MNTLHPLTTKINRRTFATAFASLPLASCATSAALAAPPSVPAECDRETLMRRYSAWLHMERRLLATEMYPEMGPNAEDYVPDDMQACLFHFPIEHNGDWRKAPQPSSRARLVLGTVGVPLEAG